MVLHGKADGGQLANGSWDEPRRTGYEYNFARYGAVTDHLPGQVTAMETLLDSLPADFGSQNHFVGSCIGANDFFPGTTDYHDFYWFLDSLDFETQIQPTIDARMALAEDAIDAAVANDINLVLANIPDYGIAPYTYSDWGAEYSDGEKRDNVNYVIGRVNDELAELAQRKGVPLIDIHAMTKAIFGENTDSDAMDPDVTKKIGDVPIYTHQPDVLGDSDESTKPDAAWVHDGIHPHTTVQGVFANLFMEASNLRYGTDFELFTEEEIVENAGLTYGGQDTLFTELGPQYSEYRDFITVIPEPGALTLLLSGLVASQMCRRRRK